MNACKAPLYFISCFFVVFILSGCNSKSEESSPVPTQEPTFTLHAAKDSVTEEKSKQVFDSTVACKDLGGSMENGYTRVCDFHSKKISEAYSYLIESGDHTSEYLERILPVKDTTVKFQDVDVIYRWHSIAKLSIDLMFAGGETKMTFEEKGDYTSVTFFMSPD